MGAAIRRAFLLLLHRRLLVLVALGACAVAFVAAGQVGRQERGEPRHVGGVTAAADHWKHDGKPRLVVRKNLQSAIASDGLAATVLLDVRLDEEFQEAWEIWRIDLVEVPANGKEKIVESIQCIHNLASRFHAKEYLTGLRGNGRSYAVVVFLHAHGDVSEQAINVAKRAIMDGQGVTIKDVPQPWSEPTPSLCLRTPSSSPQ